MTRINIRCNIQFIIINNNNVTIVYTYKRGAIFKVINLCINNNINSSFIVIIIIFKIRLMNNKSIAKIYYYYYVKNLTKQYYNVNIIIITLFIYSFQKRIVINK